MFNLKSRWGGEHLSRDDQVVLPKKRKGGRVPLRMGKNGTSFECHIKVNNTCESGGRLTIHLVRTRKSCAAAEGRWSRRIIKKISKLTNAFKRWIVSQEGHLAGPAVGKRLAGYGNAPGPAACVRARLDVRRKQSRKIGAISEGERPSWATERIGVKRQCFRVVLSCSLGVPSNNHCKRPRLSEEKKRRNGRRKSLESDRDQPAQ